MGDETGPLDEQTVYDILVGKRGRWRDGLTGVVFKDGQFKVGAFSFSDKTTKVRLVEYLDRDDGMLIIDWPDRRNQPNLRENFDK